MAKYYPKSQIIPNLYASDGVNNRIGGTLLLSTTKETYTGFFWATSDGKYFTGKIPSDKPNIELIKDNSDESTSPFDPLDPISKTKSKLALFFNDPEIEVRGLAGSSPSGNPNWGWSQLDVVRYALSKGVSLNDPPEYDNPYTNPVVPSDTDYTLGSFYRYFAKKRNANLFIEIDKEVYDNIKGRSNSITYFDYKVFKVLWTLTGNQDHVKQVNKNSIDLVSRTLNLQGLSKFLMYDYLKYYKS